LSYDARIMTGALAIIRGGGELGTAVAHGFARARLRVLVVDRPLPSALRLSVAFATAAVQGCISVEGIEAVHCLDLPAIAAAWAAKKVAVYTADPAPLGLHADVLVDARMRRLTEPLVRREDAPLVIGIGPGFEAGGDVHYVIESNRGPRLGELLTSGRAEQHTGIPGEVLGEREARIMRAPRAGAFARRLGLGDWVEPGTIVGDVEGEPVIARLSGMIRGLKLTGVPVGAGHKVGDVDPRRDQALLTTMTDKAKAVAAGALKALVLAHVLPDGGDPRSG